jgi:hypothetical protein
VIHVTDEQTVWLMFTTLLFVIAGVFCIGYYCGREDTTDVRNWEKRPGTEPYRPVLDDFDHWQISLLDEPGERLADTGEMRDLPQQVPGYQRSARHAVEVQQGPVTGGFRAAAAARTDDFIEKMTREEDAYRKGTEI